MTNEIRLIGTNGANVVHLVLEQAGGNGISTECWVAIASGVVALAALWVAWYQISHQRRHDRLSMMPHLDFHVSLANNIPWNITLRNSGLGPAQIMQCTITVNEIAMKNPTPLQLREALEKIGIPSKVVECEFTFRIPELVRTDDEHSLLRLVEEGGVIQQYGPKLKRLEWQIEYTSAYGDRKTLLVSFPELM